MATEIERSVKLAWRPKSKELRERGPRPLEFRHRDGKREIAEPKREANDWVYLVSDEYARSLLSENGDRFKLIDPPKMLVGFPNAKGAREYREVFSVLKKKGFNGEGVNEEDEDTDPSDQGKTLDMPGREPIGPESDKPPETKPVPAGAPPPPPPETF